MGVTHTVSQIIQQTDAAVRVVMKYKIEMIHTYNIIADHKNQYYGTDYGATQNVVMIGSHLDSVPEGPGLNDNGSGSA